MENNLSSDKDKSVKTIRIQDIPILKHRYSETIKLVTSFSRDVKKPSLAEVIYNNVKLAYRIL